MRSARRMPALFVGHGSPMNAIEDSAFRRGWQAIAHALPRPDTILCVSAHWETSDLRVTTSPWPGTIHDFFGFPAALSAVRYPAPGSSELTAEVEKLLSQGGETVRPDPERGLDHGAWSVLRAMYPDADVPVAQLSLNARRPPAWHARPAPGPVTEPWSSPSRQRQHRPQPRGDRRSPQRRIRLGDPLRQRDRETPSRRRPGRTIPIPGARARRRPSGPNTGALSPGALRGRGS